MQESIFINDPETTACFLCGESLTFHRRTQSIGNTNAGGACAEHDDLLLLQTLSGDLDRAQNRSQCDRGGSLDVIVEGQQFVAIAVEDGARMKSREIFP